MSNVILKIMFILVVGMSAVQAQLATNIQRCYWIEPTGAPQDNALEVVLLNEVSPGVYSGFGWHEDLQGVRTPISTTSHTVVAADGSVTYSRYAFGVLGLVDQQIDLANQGNLLAMQSVPKPAIFTSVSVIVPGYGTGSFRATVWHHDFDEIQVVHAANIPPGKITRVNCN